MTLVFLFGVPCLSGFVRAIFFLAYNQGNERLSLKRRYECLSMLVSYRKRTERVYLDLVFHQEGEGTGRGHTGFIREVFCFTKMTVLFDLLKMRIYLTYKINFYMDKIKKEII